MLVERKYTNKHKVRPEILNDRAKKLFEAIMKIADGRNKAEADLYEANHRIVDLMGIIAERDKIIDKRVTWINYHEDPFEDCHENNISCADVTCEDCIRKYFEARCK